jgi:hypothetical protein
MPLAKCQFAQLNGKKRLQIINTCNAMTQKNVNEIKKQRNTNDIKRKENKQALIERRNVTSLVKLHNSFDVIEKLTK